MIQRHHGRKSLKYQGPVGRSRERGGNVAQLLGIRRWGRRALWLAAAALLPAPRLSSGAPEAVDPKAIVGEWGLQIRQADHTEEAMLQFRFESGVLQGSFTGSDGSPIELTRVQLAEDRIAWDVDVSSGTAHATGTVNGAIMTGKLRFEPWSQSEGPRRSGPGRQLEESRPGQSRNWTAYKRVKTEPAPGAAPAPGVPAPASSTSAPPPPAAPEPSAAPDRPPMEEAEIRRRASRVYIVQDEERVSACKALGKIEATAPLSGGVVEIRHQRLTYKTATELVKLKTVDAGGNAFLSNGLEVRENDISYRGTAYLCPQP
jgi:hypothetical protein